MRTPPPVLPERPDHSGDRPSWLQRQGPDVGLVYRFAGAFVLIVPASLLVGFVVARRLGLHGFPATLVSLAVAGMLTAAAGFFILKLTDGAGAAALAIVQPSGRSNPYEEQYSFQESLAARGDAAGALESYEAVIAEHPDAPLPRLRAAELHARRGGDTARAAELFRSVRDLPSASRRDALYASNRLVDLYDGPLAEPGRALIELRRMIDRYPDSPEARGARAALPRLKAQLNENGRRRGNDR